MRLLFLLPLTVAQAGLQVQPARAEPREVVSPRDPWEGYNRWMFNVNRKVDGVTLKPLAKGYKRVAPGFVQRGVANLFNNISEPWTFGNAVLQAKPDTAFRTLGRFLINSTVGIAGLFPVAQRWGVQQDEEDFGQTLAVWGIPSGPYLMLPGFGPSNPRDAVGRVVKILYEPINLVISKEAGTLEGYAETGADFFNTRVQLLDTVDPVLDASADPYVTTRSAWFQNRPYRILDGNVPAAPGDDPFEDDTESQAPPPDTATPEAGAPQARLDSRTAGDMCMMQDCTPAELDSALQYVQAGMPSDKAVDRARGVLP